MERLRAQLTAMVTGWDAATVHDIVRETLHEIVDPLVYAEAADLIEEHRAAGREIVIVSSSGAEMVEPIGEMLGVDRVVATRMVVGGGALHRRDRLLRLRREQGRGHARGSPPRAATTWPTATPTATRSPTCRCCPPSGHPTAVNPDRALRKAALERGWPVLQFTRPVSMRARFSAPPTPVVTGAAMGVGAAVVGLAWYARHRALRAAPKASAAGLLGPHSGRRRRRGA